MSDDRSLLYEECLRCAFVYSCESVRLIFLEKQICFELCFMHITFPLSVCSQEKQSFCLFRVGAMMRFQGLGNVDALSASPVVVSDDTPTKRARSHQLVGSLGSSGGGDWASAAPKTPVASANPTIISKKASCSLLCSTCGEACSVHDSKLYSGHGKRQCDACNRIVSAVYRHGQKNHDVLKSFKQMSADHKLEYFRGQKRKRAGVGGGSHLHDF